MLLIQQITSDPYQQQQLVLPDGSTVTIQMRYRDLQYGWFIESLTYKTFTLQGVRICVSPNLLRQFKNQIPFGLCCLTNSGAEPTQIQDFSSGNAQLFIVTAAEVAEYEAYLAGGSP
jgi:hypothetical protein